VAGLELDHVIPGRDGKGHAAAQVPCGRCQRSILEVKGSTVEQDPYLVKGLGLVEQIGGAVEGEQRRRGVSRTQVQQPTLSQYRNQHVRRTRVTRHRLRSIDVSQGGAQIPLLVERARRET